MKNRTSLSLTCAAMIAALYVVVSLLCRALFPPIGQVQLRFSEALCVLPCFSFCAVPGVTLGCLLSNLLTGCHPLDVLLGTLATLIGALGTRALRGNRVLCLLPPLISNTLIIPFLMKYVYAVPFPLWQDALIVLAGEILSCCLPGQLLYKAFSRVFRRLGE